MNDRNELEYVALFIGTTTILDQMNNEASVSEAGDSVSFGDPIDIEYNLPDNLSGRDYVFARIGLKVDGIPELLFSQVYKINL
ncbi:MAG: DUF3823 domain-containing protein [Balneolaceae bacterium]|nr:DUF3823 domain-containing protein [Balneolaceae bacterium]